MKLKTVLETTAAALLLCCALPALAVTGTVVEEDGTPILEVQVCYYHAGAEQLCVETNAHGLFSLLDSSLDRLRASKSGYHPVVFSARGQQAPVVMKRSPILWVKLADAVSGESLAEGKLFVVYPSGAEKGPFPVNRAGVKIERVLEAGEVLLRAEASGYEPSGPSEAELVPGEMLEIEIELSPEGKAEKKKKR